MENPIIAQVNQDRLKLEKICKASETLPFEQGEFWLSLNTICVKIKHELSTIRQFRKAIAPEWKPRKFNFANTMNDGCFVWEYENADGVQMTVYTKILKGQSCRRVKVSEKTIPIYKIVCD